MKRLLVIAVAAALLLTGCSANDGLAAQYGKGDTKGFISGDGTSTFFKADSRGDTVSFTSTTDDGVAVDSAQYAGRVVVLNFWYGDCAPCRTEAPKLESIYSSYAGKDVDFLGVNTRDGAARSQQFAAKYNVTYPSVLDADDGNVLLAFADSVPANATPVTLVLDEKGRVAARISGELDDPSLLTGYIDEVLDEGA